MILYQNLTATTVFIYVIWLSLPPSAIWVAQFSPHTKTKTLSGVSSSTEETPHKGLVYCSISYNIILRHEFPCCISTSMLSLSTKTYLCYKDDYYTVILLVFRKFIEQGMQCGHQVTLFFPFHSRNTHHQWDCKERKEKPHRLKSGKGKL